LALQRIEARGQDRCAVEVRDDDGDVAAHRAAASPAEEAPRAGLSNAIGAEVSRTGRDAFEQGIRRRIEAAPGLPG
jgi:hypothetical protein